MKKYLDTRRYGTKEQEAYTSDVNQLRVEYGDGVQPEERIGNDGEGIEVTYYIETSEEKRIKQQNDQAMIAQQTEQMRTKAETDLLMLKHKLELEKIVSLSDGWD